MAGVVEKKKPTSGRALGILQTVIGFTCSILVSIGFIPPLPVFVIALAFLGVLFFVFAYSLKCDRAWVDDAWLGFLSWFFNSIVIFGSTFNIDFIFTFGMICLFIPVAFLATFVLFPQWRTLIVEDWKRWRYSRHQGTRLDKSIKWYSRKHMEFIGFVLLAIGICSMLVFFPTMPILASLLFALAGGPGVFISYKQKSGRGLLFCSFLITSWGYAFCVIMFGVGFTNAFFYDFTGIVFPILALGGVPFAWFGNRRWKTPGFRTLKNALVLYVVYLILLLPLFFSGIWDYNVRADASPPEVISMNVISKRVSTDDLLYLTVETTNGDFRFSIRVTDLFYYEHDIGSTIEVAVRKGALGYSWVEGYS